MSTSHSVNSRLVKLVDVGKISKDYTSLVSQSERKAGALLWIHGIVVALKKNEENRWMIYTLEVKAQWQANQMKDFEAILHR